MRVLHARFACMHGSKLGVSMTCLAVPYAEVSSDDVTRRDFQKCDVKNIVVR